MKYDNLIKELKAADLALEKEGYKSWSYPRLAISEAIKEFERLQ